MESKDWVLLISLAAIWGSAFMFIKISAVDFGPILLVTLRLLIAGLVFMPLLLQRQNRLKFKSYFPSILKIIYAVKPARNIYKIWIIKANPNWLACPKSCGVKALPSITPSILINKDLSLFGISTGTPERAPNVTRIIGPIIHAKGKFKKLNKVPPMIPRVIDEISFLNDIFIFIRLKKNKF